MRPERFQRCSNAVAAQPAAIATGGATTQIQSFSVFRMVKNMVLQIPRSSRISDFT